MIIKTKIEDFQIRKAEKSDVPLVLEFIMKLAAYEKLSHEVVATETELERYLFGQEKVAEVVLGFYRDTPVGFALYFFNFSTFLARPGIYLEDLYVLEEYRGKGIDVMLGVKLLESARKRHKTILDSHLIMEQNTRMRAECDRMNGKIVKRFRIFQKSLIEI